MKENCPRSRASVVACLRSCQRLHAACLARLHREQRDSPSRRCVLPRLWMFVERGALVSHKFSSSNGWKHERTWHTSGSSGQFVLMNFISGDVGKHAELTENVKKWHFQLRARATKELERLFGLHAQAFVRSETETLNHKASPGDLDNEIVVGTIFVQNAVAVHKERYEVYNKFKQFLHGVKASACDKNNFQELNETPTLAIEKGFVCHRGNIEITPKRALEKCSILNREGSRRTFQHRPTSCSTSSLVRGSHQALGRTTLSLSIGGRRRKCSSLLWTHSCKHALQDEHSRVGVYSSLSSCHVPKLNCVVGCSGPCALHTTLANKHCNDQLPATRHILILGNWRY